MARRVSFAKTAPGQEPTEVRELEVQGYLHTRSRRATWSDCRTQVLHGRGGQTTDAGTMDGADEPVVK